MWSIAKKKKLTVHSIQAYINKQLKTLNNITYHLKKLKKKQINLQEEKNDSYKN